MRLCASDWDWNPHARTGTQPKPRLGLEPKVFQLESLILCLDLLRLILFMSQCRRGLARGKVIGKKKVYINIGSLKRMQAERQGALPQELSKLYFYNQKKVRKGGKIAFFLILWIDIRLTSLAPPSYWTRGYLTLWCQTRTVLLIMQVSIKVAMDTEICWMISAFCIMRVSHFGKPPFP